MGVQKLEDCEKCEYHGYVYFIGAMFAGCGYDGKLSYSKLIGKNISKIDWQHMKSYTKKTIYVRKKTGDKYIFDCKLSNVDTAKFIKKYDSIDCKNG